MQATNAFANVHAVASDNHKVGVTKMQANVAASESLAARHGSTVTVLRCDARELPLDDESVRSGCLML